MADGEDKARTMKGHIRIQGYVKNCKPLDAQLVSHFTRSVDIDRDRWRSDYFYEDFDDALREAGWLGCTEGVNYLDAATITVERW